LREVIKASSTSKWPTPEILASPSEKNRTSFASSRKGAEIPPKAGWTSSANWGAHGVAPEIERRRDRRQPVHRARPGAPKPPRDRQPVHRLHRRFAESFLPASARKGWIGSSPGRKRKRWASSQRRPRLNCQNLPDLLRIPNLVELNIGHSIMSRAIIVGLANAVKETLALMKDYPEP
jgi:hypothetical protein